MDRWDTLKQALIEHPDDGLLEVLYGWTRIDHGDCIEMLVALQECGLDLRHEAHKALRLPRGELLALVESARCE